MTNNDVKKGPEEPQNVQTDPRYDRLHPVDQSEAVLLQVIAQHGGKLLTDDGKEVSISETIEEMLTTADAETETS